MPRERRRICFVTGTRAEFGLMRSTLRSIQNHPKLKLQIVVTGMHLSGAHGKTLNAIRRDGWTIDAIAPWAGSNLAVQTGRATASLGKIFDRLKSDVILVVGDRVEAFAAATAGHLSQRVVAHVHGGDRAMGQVDDSLRHAITKLAHVHLTATKCSAERVRRLGEEKSRVHIVGAPGIDDIQSIAAKFLAPSPGTPGEGGGEGPSSTANDKLLRKNPHPNPLPAYRARGQQKFALVVLHPTGTDSSTEFRRASLVLDAVRTKFGKIEIVYPNNDPGCDGIIRRWQAIRKDPNVIVHRDLSRPVFLGLLRDAAVLVGNSSSGIIEAASFGTPVVDIGPRQSGRECSGNVVHVPFDRKAINAALRKLPRFRGQNVYGGGAGKRIASILSELKIDSKLRQKLIAY